jgi:hypothetical protein
VLGHRTLGGSLSYQGMSGHYEATTSAIGIGTPKRLSCPACARFRYIDKRRASYWEKSKAAALVASLFFGKYKVSCTAP